MNPTLSRDSFEGQKKKRFITPLPTWQPKGRQEHLVHRIIEQFGLEGTFKGHLAPTPPPRAVKPSTKPGCSKSAPI